MSVHIQSHFIVYRKRFVQNPELQAFWDTMPMIESYTDSVQRWRGCVHQAARGQGAFKRMFMSRPMTRRSLPDYPLLVCPTLLLKKVPAFQAPALCMSWRPPQRYRVGELVQELYDYLRDGDLPRVRRSCLEEYDPDVAHPLTIFTSRNLGADPHFAGT